MLLVKSSIFLRNMYKVVLIIVLILVLIFAPQFIIRVKTECKSQYGDCPKELGDGVRKSEVGSLYQTRKNIKKYLKNNNSVSNYSTQFKLPNTLVVNLLIKKPIFAIKDNLTNRIFLLDKDGNILSEEKTTLLPTVIQEGQKPNLNALRLMLGVYLMYQTTTGDLQNDSLTVELTPQLKVIFPVEGENDVLLGSLRLIYEKIQSDPKSAMYKEIDLRFKNPVLR